MGQGRGTAFTSFLDLTNFVKPGEESLDEFSSVLCPPMSVDQLLTKKEIKLQEWGVPVEDSVKGKAVSQGGLLHLGRG